MKMSRYIPDSEEEKNECIKNNADLDNLESCYAMYESNEAFNNAVFVKREGDTDILFSEDIKNDDEIFLLQCPQQVNVNSLKHKFIDIENDALTSKIRLRCNPEKRKFKVYTRKSPGVSLNCILPSKHSKNFTSNVFPLSGRIILQQTMNKEYPSSAFENVVIKEEVITPVKTEQTDSPKIKKRKLK